MFIKAQLNGGGSELSLENTTIISSCLQGAERIQRTWEVACAFGSVLKCHCICTFRQPACYGWADIVHEFSQYLWGIFHRDGKRMARMCSHPHQLLHGRCPGGGLGVLPCPGTSELGFKVKSTSSALLLERQCG